MKLLIVVSSLDLARPFSATPAWWQLLEALAAHDTELLVTPYAGRAIQTTRWRAYENPCLVEAEAVCHARRWLRGAAPTAASAGVEGASGGRRADRAERILAHGWTRWRWRRHLTRIIEAERAVDALIVMAVPANHLGGIPGRITSRYGIPCFYLDGDVPASLPAFGGFASGFRGYDQADLGEYQAVFSNSKGGADGLIALGARRVIPLYYGVDPTLFRPYRAIAQDIDAFFYGHGVEYRHAWVTAMVSTPSRALPHLRFAVRGAGFERFDLGRAERLPYGGFGAVRAYAGRAKINLLINRQAHAAVYASSTSRPFELAAMGCCMLSSPYLGIEEWFEPDRELLVLDHPDAATERIRWLLDHPAQRATLGAAARRRALGEHTYAHRARQMLTAIAEAVGTWSGT